MEIPESSSHKKTFFSAIFVIIVLLLAVILLAMNRKPTIEEQKQNIVERLKNVDTRPLTSEETAGAINFVSRGGATYTEAEKVEITRILRAQ